MAGPILLDLKTYKAAGVDPKTLLPDRMTADEAAQRKANFRRIFRIIDEQDAVNRYKWYNLPCNLSSEELERMLYYKGQLCFFYFKELDEFYILPYALDGTIDLYGRYNRVHPIPFAAGTSEEEKKAYNKQAELLSLKKLKVIKAPMAEEDVDLSVFEEGCVLLFDYTRQANVNNILPRAELNDAFSEVESDILPYMSTALLAGTGIKGMRVNDADAADETQKASSQIKTSALAQKLFVAMTHSVEFQELADSSPMKTEEFLLALQGIDNVRKGALGIENGGIFQKKAHKLQSEQTGNESSVATVFQDGLSCRQYFATIANSIWGLDMWCEPAEAVVGEDLNLDGVIYDRNAGSQGGFDSGEPAPAEGEK